MERTGFFAGSFDPPTLGHLDLVRRASRLVDRLVVGIGRNVEKRAWLAVEQRQALLRELVPVSVEVVVFDGLAVTAARAAGATLLVRGVRSGADMSAEMTMALANSQLDETLETVMLVTSPDVAHVSSRLVREVHRSGGPVERFVPPEVARVLARLEEQG